MHSHFTHELGYLALAVRLKKIQEMMMHSARSLYKELDFDIEPNWYLIFLLLKKETELSVTQIAEHLNISHPSVVNIIKKMRERGFLEICCDTKDYRRQLVSLSIKGSTSLPEFEKIWSTSEEVIKEAFADSSTFLDELATIEHYFNTQSYKERTLKKLTNE